MRKKLLTAAGLAVVAAAVATSAIAGGTRASDATVTLRDFKIVMPAKLPAGQTTLTFRNAGKNPHNVVAVYRSKGATRIATPQILPGKSTKISLNLRPGAYTVLCTVFNGFHAASGMVKSFQVGTIDFKTGTWK